MTFLNMDAMSVASNCSIIYYTPQGGYFFFLNWRGVLWKSGGGGKPPLGGARNIPAGGLDASAWVAIARPADAVTYPANLSIGYADAAAVPASSCAGAGHTVQSST